MKKIDFAAMDIYPEAGKHIVVKENFMAEKHNDISEEMAISIVKEFTSNPMYILLSTVQANMIKGYSYPYVKQIDEHGKLLFVFSSLEYAKEFIKVNDFEILDGVYPLAKIEPKDALNSFEVICAIAAHLGIMYIDFNPAHPNIAMGVTIPWLQKALDYDLNKITLLMSPQAKEEMEKRGDGKVPLGFNPMPIYDFKDPYTISDERKEELDKIPLNNISSVEKYFDAIKGLTMPELIYISNLLSKSYIPKANSEGNKLNVDMYIAMLHVLDSTIIQRVDKLDTFTLLDGEDMFVNNNQAAYLIYTDRFQYMGEYRYKEVSLDGYLGRLQVNDVNYVMITAGPGQMHITTPKAIEETIKKIR